ncbi:DUF465 domain-containing protein [Sulfitobacter sp. R18_1]|uniref:DUF465 domain-containing protein n=1 Tax=Sulfitobacter sp. R18_1 TaxID=2821104 RepID=UPI001ADC5C75|nr:DUF465 domain-containing protein [Sulfitobacter sp. R18_1]MBO9428712.1 DUF465 domain-containing protein [Sulfitobacter sp. R18_1]
MTEHPRLEALQARHRELDTRIQEEERRPSPETDKVTALKKEKMKVKEEITHFETENA